MAEIKQKQYAVNAPIYRDESKINGQTADLTAFCELLNTTFAMFVKGGCIDLKDITQAMVNAVASFDAAPIIDVVTKSYNSEASRIEYKRAKRYFLEGKDAAISDIQATIEEMRKQYEREALKYYKPKEGGYWRLRYLQVEDGFVTFNRTLLIEDNTDKIRGKQHEAFLKKANDLYTQICAFNDECKRLSGGAVRGVDYVMGGDALITINEQGKCIFDASLSANMRFEKDL